MTIIDRITAKMAKLRTDAKTRQHAQDLLAQAVEEAARVRTAEILDLLRADMMGEPDTFHLRHLDALDVIQANYAV